MSSSDKDLNIPDLGPAQRDIDVAPGTSNAIGVEPVSPHVASMQSEAVQSAVTAPLATPGVQGGQPVVVKRRAFGIFTGGLLLLVLAACAGLGYWVMELETQFRGRSAELTDARYQIGELRELLQTAESSALQSGKSVISQINEIANTVTQRYKTYDAELVKLSQAVGAESQQLAAQQNQLAEQKTLLAQQASALSAQDGQLTDLLALVEAQKVLLDEQAVALAAHAARLEVAEQQVTALDRQTAGNADSVKSLASLQTAQAQLETAQASQQQSTQQALTDMRAELQSAQFELSTQTEILQEQLAEQSEQLAALNQQAGQSNAVDPATQRRIKVNEDAIRAFDGTRRQLNQELLQIRKRLNNLQLKVEQR